MFFYIFEKMYRLSVSTHTFSVPITINRPQDMNTVVYFTRNIKALQFCPSHCVPFIFPSNVVCRGALCLCSSYSDAFSYIGRDYIMRGVLCMPVDCTIAYSACSPTSSWYRVPLAHTSTHAPTQWELNDEI